MSSIGSPYIVRWTFGPFQFRNRPRQATPVSIRNEPPNRRTTFRTVRSSAGSRVEMRTASAPNTRAVKATWVVTRLSRAGRCPNRRTLITGLPLRLNELHLLEEPEGVGTGRAELLLDLPGRLPARGDFLEHLALDLRIDRAENRNQFGDLAHYLDAIQRNPRARYPAVPL